MKSNTNAPFFETYQSLVEIVTPKLAVVIENQETLQHFQAMKVEFWTDDSILWTNMLSMLKAIHKLQFTALLNNKEYLDKTGPVVEPSLLFLKVNHQPNERII